MRALFLAVGDILALYFSLFLTLFFRYGTRFYDRLIDQHLLPFSIVFALWIIIFYVAGLYELRRLRNNLDFLKTLGLTISVSGVATVLFFYLIPAFGITPKTNLFIFIIVFAVIEVFWRRAFNQAVAALEPSMNVVLVGDGGTSDELVIFLGQNRQLGYEVTSRLGGASLPPQLNRIDGWRKLIRENRIDLIVIPPNLKKESRIARIFYELLTLGVEIQDLPHFYETVFRKVPLREINEEWFLEKIAEHHKFYDDLKRGLEFFFALLLQVVLIPLEVLIVLMIKANSPGPAICAQVRIGQHGRPFTLYKFRSMTACTEKDGPKWAEADDKRVTFMGKILRASHLDELPQLINIIKGGLSFVGPRPERPEFVKILSEKIPHYNIRHLIKPGLTGWAQINYRYGASIEDAYEKLQYDIYYLKNRSIILDMAIILKTIKSFFVNQK